MDHSPHLPFYKAVFEHVPGILIVAALESGRILDVNQAAVEAYGYSREEFLSLFLSDLCESDRDALVVGELASLEAGSKCFESIHRRKDLSMFDVQLHIAKSDIVGLHCLIVAVSPLDSFQREDDWGRALFAWRTYCSIFSADMVVIHANGRVLFVDEPGLRMLGATGVQEIIGRPVLDFVHEESVDVVVNRILHTQAERMPSGLEQIKLVSLDGRVLEAEAVTLPVLFDQETASQVMLRDVSSQRSVERDLRESRAQWETFVEHSADPMLIQDTRGNVLRANHAFESAYGWSNTELAGKRPPLVPRHLESESDALIQIVKSGIPIPAFDTTRMRKDGNSVDVSIALSPICNSDGRVTGIVSILRDVSRRIRMEQDLRNSMTELQRTQNILREKEKLSIISKIAGGIAHEIRNPLTSIKGFVQLIGRRHASDPVVADYIDIILQETDRANHVINDFLRISQPGRLQLQTVKMEELLQEAAEHVKSRAAAKGVIFRTIAAESSAQCTVDRRQILQVILNLCENAIEATNKDGSVTVELSTDIEMAEIHIEVRDTGCGISTERLDQISVPFYSTKDGGMGLGLSISYAIVEAHRGRVEVESGSQGTRFRVCLPIDPTC